MKDIIINHNSDKIDIVVLENEKVVEQYQETHENKAIEGNVYIGKVINVLNGMQAAFVDIGEEKNAFLHIKDVLPKAREVTGNKNEKLNEADIRKYIRVGMPIIVQIKKDKVETKGARISTNLNIPGKYLAIIPNSNFITVSSKIEDEKEIERLKSIIEKNRVQDIGFVIRTAACGKTEQQLAEEIQKLTKTYNHIMDLAKENIANNCYPQKIYEVGGIINKVMLGVVDDTRKIIINDKILYDYVVSEYPEVKENTIFEEKDNVLTADICSQIEKLKNRKIWLNCGGFITIDKTEALTAIDVNTGKYTGSNSLEETILKVNEEATIEIAKQIRARDIGGIIIIDYIDMEEESSEKKIIDILNRELKKDRAKNQVIGFTPLHLLEMTRKHLYSN